MFCKKCGLENSENFFCTICGTPLKNTQINTQRPHSKNILSIILCMLIVIFTLLSLSLNTFKSGLADEKISHLISNLNIKTVFKSDAVISLTENTATIEDIERIYKNGTFNIFIKNTLKDYSNYILTGEIPNGVSSDDIVNLMRENAYTIKEFCGYELTEKDYKSIQRYFDKEGANILGIFSSDIRANQYTEIVHMLCSNITISVIIAFIFLLIFLLVKTRYHKSDLFIWLALTLIVSVIIYNALIVWLSSTNYIINSYIRNISGVTLKYSSVLISISCILYFCYIVIKKYNRLKEKNFEI